MKKRIIATACLTLMSGLASAESNVQLFGIVDAGYLYQSKANGAGSLSQFATSGLRQSVWGIKGTEDVGNGTKAFFNLESHFDTDTGALHGTGDAPGSGTILFRRQANVGLGNSEWGQLILGRQYGPALLAHIGTEPRAFKEQFSNLYAWAYNMYAATAGINGTNTNNDVGIFLKNAVQYRNTVGPVDFGVAYSFGEVAGSFSKNNIYALGASYKGPVALSFSYQAMKDVATGATTVKQSGLGAAYAYGDYTFKANFLNAKNHDANGASNSNVNAIGVGVDYKWNDRNSATLAYYDNKDRNNSNDATRNIVLSNDYFLSKRTTLYVQGAYVDAKSQASIKTSIVAAGIPEQNAKTFLLNVGINHTF